MLLSMYIANPIRWVFLSLSNLAPRCQGLLVVPVVMTLPVTEMPAGGES